ncbi:MAG: hypothetical protein IIC66_06005 [candidate division Zixibacteria bacterium]|nr:hypothetical protein [candidate division Zixibacteria bacterium]
MPLNITSEPVKFHNAMDLFDSLLAKELLDSELEVTIVPVEESDSLQGYFIKQLGGLFDPYSGKLDLEKTRTWRRTLISEVEKKYKVDAILFTRISTVSAHFFRDQAKWDGVTESIGKDRFFKSLLGLKHSGSIPALSLIVELRATNDSLLYQNAGGIQVLQKIGTGSRPEDRPYHEILTDEKRNQDAVVYAIHPLLGRSVKRRPGSINRPKTRSSLLESK